MSRLTDRTYITGITSTDLIHVVVTGDTSQSADGSSYKATIQQLATALGSPGFSGGTVPYDTYFSTNLSANTFYATTYLNLPKLPYLPLSGGTVTGDTIFTSGLTANTFYATTYLNLPKLPYLPLSGGTVTGGTIFTSGLTANTLNISSTPTTDTQLGTEYLTRNSLTGEVRIKQIAGPTVYGLFAQTGNSVVVSATTVESTIINGGIGTLTVPANGFSIGDSFRADFGGLLSAKNNDTIRIKVKAGSVILADSGTQTLSTSVNDVWQFSVNFTIRQLGAAGVASIVSLGVFHTTKQSNNTQGGFAFNTVNSTTFDTTISNTLDVTAEWSSNSPLNSIYSDIFVLNKIF